MDHRITYTQVIARLDENALPYSVLPLHNGTSVIILQRGGRVLGPFESEDAASLFWLNAVWADAGAFKAYIDAGEANVGGERIWIAPELQYHVQDRNNFEASYVLPPQIDPGTYTLNRSSTGIHRLRQSMTLDTCNLASGQKTLGLEIRIQPVPDPLRGLAAYESLLDSVTYAGYEQIVTLTEQEPDSIRSASWNLIQLVPGGQVIIPIAPPFEVTDYRRGPLPDGACTRHANGYLGIPINGVDMFKVGYKAAHVAGRMAYINQLDGDRAYLLVRAFTNNPSTVYIEEPAHRPGVIGDSVHVFNSSKAIGSFGEMECQGQTIGGNTGLTTATDRFSLWAYMGETEKLRAIAAHLLGVEL